MHMIVTGLQIEMQRLALGAPPPKKKNLAIPLIQLNLAELNHIELILNGS